MVDIKNDLQVFLISSVISLITITYLRFAYVNNGYPENVPFKSFYTFIPLLYGVFGLINYYVVGRFGINNSFLVGGVFGLLLSSIGRFGLNLPELLFNFTKDTEYKVHLFAVLLYSMIFRFIMTPLTKLV